MPLAGPILGTTILRYFAASGHTGAQAANLAMAIGNGTINSILATNVYNGSSIGTGPGPGSGTGKVVGLVGPIVGQNIYTFMLSRGFSGSQVLNQSIAIGNAFAEHILTAGIVTSLGAPTAIGVGTGPIVGIVGITVAASILQFMIAAGMTGAQNFNLAGAIGDGIALSMSTAIVQTTIVGVPAPPPTGVFPAAGIETGKLT